MIKQILENTIRNLENERTQRIAQVSQAVMSEKVAPHNREIDTAREKAIAELSTALNQKIVALQEDFSAQKQLLVEKGEKNKAEFAKTAIATETSLIELEYNNAIKAIQTQIEKLGE